jgi:hypothetical protein
MNFSKLNKLPFPLLFTIYSAPLNKIYWDVGFRIRIYYVAIILCLLVFGVRNLFTSNGFHKKYSFPSICYILIFSISVLSLAFALDKIQCIKGIGDLLIGLLASTFIFKYAKTWDKLYSVVKHWAYVGIIMSLYGAIQFLLKIYLDIDLDEYVIAPITLGVRRSGLDGYGQFFRITSLIEDSSNYSIYLLTILPIVILKALGGWIDKNNKQFFLWGASFLLMFFNLLLTMSRSGLVAFVILIPLVIHYLLYSRNINAIDSYSENVDAIKSSAKKTARNRRAFLIILSFFAVITALILSNLQVMSEIMSMRTEASEGTKLHFELLYASVDLTFTKPLGVGINNFPVAFSEYYQPNEPPIWSTFNAYTLISSELGFQGCITYFFLFSFLIRNLLNKVRVTNLLEQKDIYMGLYLCLIGVMISSISYTSFNNGYFQVFMGMLIAASLIDSETQGDLVNYTSKHV